MKVLTIYAHHNPRLFCHAVLQRFIAGLRDAGHTNEVVDLHAIHFDFRTECRLYIAMKSHGTLFVLLPWFRCALRLYTLNE